MLRGSQIRRAGRAIDPVFLDRWSPRAMTGAAIPVFELERLFEAARWAPSSYNAQPWRFVYATRHSEPWKGFLDLLVEGNRDWAQDAAVLFVLASRKLFERNGKPSRTHAFDAGAAWENLALQGTRLGYAVHGIEGFDYARAADLLRIPRHYEVQMMGAIGVPRASADLPEALRGSERPNGRRPIDEIRFAGSFPPDVT